MSNEMDQTVQDAAVQADTEGQAGAPAASVDADALKNRVISAISECYDPEIPVNIYELGLIYDVAVSDGGKVDLVMTLTSPHCPVAEILPAQVKTKVEGVEGVDEVDLELTWDPPWSPDLMSEAAKLELGFL